MLKLNRLRPAKGSRRKTKRIGRGTGSGTGCTAGRGNNGYGARSGASNKYHFEGGQTPLTRRIPKRGFTNIFKKEYQIVNVEQLNKYSDGDTIKKETLLESGMINKKSMDVKVLGRGDILKKLTVEANAFTKSAVDKIEKAGGKAVVV